MATVYGVTAAGFVTKQQSVIISEIQAALQAALGVNINLLPEAVFGQLVGIFSEREALVWQLVEAAYDSDYPSGAEGTSVDNILALNNLRRLGASPTVTSPIEDGIPGLVFYGTPGTIIPVDSIISVYGTPTVQFQTDADYTIGSPVDAVETILFSSVPTQGSFSLSITDPSGTVLTTGVLGLTTQNAFTYSPLAAVSQILLSTPFTTSGTFKISVQTAGATLTTAAITANATPATTAANMQTALRALSGLSAITVAVGSESASGYSYAITWGAIPQPTVSTNTNTTVATLAAIDSLQAAINNLHDADESNYPYTDVSCSGSFSVGFTVNFGANAVSGSNPSSGDQPQNLFSEATNSLQDGSTVTNISILMTTIGLRAQAIGAATCTQDGPNFVPAGNLTVIGSPVSGWTSVTNPLDCVTGRNIEDDTEALARRATLLAENANGPLQAIIEKVSTVSGVTEVFGTQNLGMAAQQVVSFSGVPSAGAFTLKVAGTNTSSIPYTATASTVQTAIQAIAGYSTAVVSGTFLSGFTIDFNGSNGGQPQDLITITANTLAVTATVAFGLPGKSIQLVVAGEGSFANIAQAIFDSKPAGIETYGTPFTTTGTTHGTDQLTGLASVTGIVVGQVISGADIPLGTTVLGVAGSTVTMSNEATGSNVGESVSFTYSYTVQDNFGNNYQINWQAPVILPIYVTISLTTDLMLNGRSNHNAKFSTGSIPTIQQDIVTIGNQVPIGGTIIGFGSNGLVGAFNSVPGIVFYTIAFDITAAPAQNANISLPPAYQAFFQTFSVIVSYT